FWTTVAVKKVNDVMRLQALVDKNKVVVTKAMIRDILCLDDAEGVECLLNEEFFTELARMGYEKPFTKLTLYKAFFLSQWKFLIHTIFQCMSAKRTSWNEFSSSMAFAVICISSGRKFNFFKYIFNRLVRNVDSPTKFYMYPCFLQLMIRKQVGDLSTHTIKYTPPALTQKVFANMRRVGKGFSGVETPLFEGMVVAHEVGEGVADEVHDEGVPAAGIVAEGDVSAANDEVSTIDEEPSIPSLTPPTLPPQPSHDIPSTSQRIDTSDDTVMDDVSNQGRMIADMDEDADVVLEEAKDVATDPKDDRDTDVQVNTDIQGRTAESQPKIYMIDLNHANKVLSMQKEESEPTELKEVVDIVTTTKIITKVVTAASTTITAVDVPIPAAITAAAPTLTAALSRRTKGVVIRDPEKSTTTTTTIIHSKAKSKDKEESRALKRINETPAAKAAKRQNLREEVEELKRHLQIVSNKDDDVYTEATPLARKDFEALWSLVKERFATTKPKNFSDDFLLMTLGAMFEKSDIHAQIWKNQRSVHGQAKVKSWKLLESCCVQIITFTTTQLILLVERTYPLTRFTLDQMLNNVRLEVEEESEVSLELLSYGVDAAMDFKEKHAKCLMLLVKDLVLSRQVDESKNPHDLPTMEPEDSLSIRDEHLDTISETESDEFIKSSFKNLVPNPSESEDDIKCDVPVCDNFTTFSNFLFDADDDFSSSDNEAFSDEDISKEIYSNPLFEEIISITINPHHFNAEYHLIESLLNHDSSIISSSSKINSLLDEFAGELILLKSIPPGIDEIDCDPEEEIRLIEILLYNNSSPCPPKEFIYENSDAEIESFSPSPIPVEDSDSLMEEIDLALLWMTRCHRALKMMTMTMKGI
nr:hypothetical protein [Tanacetum cinerariifolium]